MTDSEETTATVYDNSMAWTASALITKPAAGFAFTEGAAWHPGGFFLFSDTPANKMYRLDPNGSCNIFLDNSGLSNGDTNALSDQVGSNGIAIDADENIFICQHGNHAIATINKEGEQRMLIDQFNGRPFNSPNDIIIRAGGNIFFTDPPYGLRNQVLHPDQFQPAAGIYQYNSSGIKLIGTELQYPNGLIFSHDESFLLVSSNHPDDPGILRYQCTADGDTRYTGVFMTQRADGMAAGPDGNIYLATDDGVLVVSAAAEKLALIPLPEMPSNLCWGGWQQEILLVTARSGVYFITKSM